MSDGAGKEGINLFALSLEQLNQLKQSIEEVCVPPQSASPEAARGALRG